MTEDLVAEPYCGFISKNEWQLPFNYRSETAQTKNQCEDSKFFGVFSCLWKVNSCISTHSTEGQECYVLEEEAACETISEFFAFTSCTSLEPDASTQLTIGSYCGNPGLEDPWTFPQEVCSVTGRNAMDCERATLFVAQSCFWDNNVCKAPAAAGNSQCHAFVDQQGCGVGTYFEFTSCEWYEYEAPSTGPSVTPS